jgi:hypothetical protein
MQSPSVDAILKRRSKPTNRDLEEESSEDVHMSYEDILRAHAEFKEENCRLHRMYWVIKHAPRDDGAGIRAFLDGP